MSFKIALAAIAAWSSLGLVAQATPLAPTTEQLDTYMLEVSPDLRCNMDTSSLLGTAGIGQLAGVPVYSTELWGQTHWDRRFYWSMNVGGNMMVSPRMWGSARPAAEPNNKGHLGLDAFEGMLGLNLVGVRGDSIGFEPFFDLNGRLFLTVGAGTALGYVFMTDSNGDRNQDGIGVTLGPVVAMRYKFMDWHNLNVYGRYLYGLNRAMDSYEAAIHGSVGRNVIEIGYRGGEIGTYTRYAATGAQTQIPDGPLTQGYGTWFVRFAQGY